MIETSHIMPSRVKIMEVAPRDGLQNESQIIDTASKITFIERLVSAGIKRVEITAFVSPKWIPPLADHAEVARGIRREVGVSYAGLIPNMKGFEAAMQAKLDEVAFVLAASETHNRKNINASTEDAFGRYAEIAARAKDDRIPFRAYLSCAFGCPYEGNISLNRVVDLAVRLERMGAYEISIGDTLGIGDPKQCHELLSALTQEIPVSKLALHMHDTYGRALANIYVALTHGVASFDSSAGGLGGCPYAPGAAGNVASEDLIDMLHRVGVDTGVNLGELCGASLFMERLLERPLPSKLLGVHRGKIGAELSYL